MLRKLPGVVLSHPYRIFDAILVQHVYRHFQDMTMPPSDTGAASIH
jgi:hypothetical protein